MNIPCVGCGENFFPENDGPTHPYMLSSPGCWSAYGELLAREYQYPEYAPFHRFAVDAYAVQHPGVDVPRARHSVGIHLSRLCLILALGWPLHRVNDAMLAITEKKMSYPWLTPPRNRGSFSVKHVLDASTPAEHLTAVEQWAKTAWQAWAEHHATVQDWVKDLQRARGAV
jgi:hypothetical protein